METVYPSSPQQGATAVIESGVGLRRIKFTPELAWGTSKANHLWLVVKSVGSALKGNKAGCSFMSVKQGGTASLQPSALVPVGMGAFFVLG